jgi:type II secretory pathway pseudopilin PulG
MGSNNKHGFTIIEVLLFFGISGLMIFGILAGTGTAINQQRYRDSVNSLVGHLQKQYTDISGVENQRSANWSCDSAGPSDVTPSVGVSRGASDCAILGRYITSDGMSLTSQTVVGSAEAAASTQDDVPAISAANPVAISSGQDVYPLEWNAKMMRAGNTSALAVFSMLIVRSPATGSIRTFINSTSKADPRSLVTQANLTNSVSVCVDSNGLLTGRRDQVDILSNASSASGIKLHDGATATC